MICFPNAKINLGLNILEKRTDGFHNIETVFYPIPLSDILEILPNPSSDKTEMRISGMDVPGEVTDNLCLKAYNLLKAKYNLPPVRIILHKIIPMGAGLGGGSSDAAFTLTTLNLMFELGLKDEQLMDYASQLGSDCAFFVRNVPSVGEGRGNELQSIDISLKGYFMALVKPDIHIDTAEAYTGVKPFWPQKTAGNLVYIPFKNWKYNLINDFEKSIFPKHPEISNIKDKLYEMGADYAAMTGSGAAVYGLFKSLPRLENEFTDCFYWEGEL
jgi:4-diphosphocytidyl-2-C-methyl-D-erythritol kinase